jgi:hypothetical protein
MLVAAYAVYVHSFAFVVELFGLGREVSVRFERVSSASKRQAQALSMRGLGPDHWASDPDLQIRLYNAARGFWVYSPEEERKEKGKQVVLSPFAMIWSSPDGKVLKTVTADRAILDLNAPIVGNKPEGEDLRVVHAKLEGNVRIRDDKGTPDRADDLTIALNYVEYDEAALKIYSLSTVEIVDRDMQVYGDDLQINLRPPPEGSGHASGFNGAKDAHLRHHVHIVINDVGSTGILPGASTQSQRAGEKTPLDLRCDGEMVILFAEPQAVVQVGPPAPSGPTIATFDRNVEVLRGQLVKSPDKLNCDHLRLTLVPAENRAHPAQPGPVTAKVDPSKPGTPSSPTPVPAPDSGGPLTDLVLRESYATGHNVRIKSAAQGVEARCNELIHKKMLPDSPDITYLRGDGTRKLIVEKTDTATEGERKGEVTSYTRIQTVDATIEDSGKGNDLLTIRARGPGILETRPGLDKPVEQTARWIDSLIVESVPDDKERALHKDSEAILKRITLIQNASFSDAPSKTDLTAREKIFVWLKPKPSTEPDSKTNSQGTGTKAVANAKSTASTGSALSPTTGSFDIDKLLALDDVHLTAPGREVIARTRLRAEFATLAPPAPPVPTSLPASESAPKLVVAPASDAPAEKPETASASAEPPARQAPERKSKAEADLVYARLLIHPATEQEKADAAKKNAKAGVGTRPSTGRTEVDTVRLRGTVVYHEDPAEGKERGTNVLGEAVDIDRKGQDLSRFVVFNWNPEAVQAPAKPGLGELDTFAPLARVDTDEMVILGAKIALDQSLDAASVDGLGSMTQMTERGLFSDRDGTKAVAATPEYAAAKAKDKARTRIAVARTEADAVERPKKVPMTITFTLGMRFYGRPTHPDSILARQAFVHKKFTDVDVPSEDWPAARAEFYQNVHVDMEDSRVDCRDHMMVYLDRPVTLAKPPGDLSSPSSSKSADPETDDVKEKADIALVECSENVRVINQKLDPQFFDETGKRLLLEKQDLEGDYLVYDKVTGRFRIPGKGIVFLYQREGQGSTPSDPGIRGLSRPERRPEVVDEPRTIRRTAAQVNSPQPPSRSEMGPRADANRTRPDAKTKAGGSAKTKAKAATAALKPLIAPLVLTQIRFGREMVGRFGSGKETDKNETREADFFRDVESIHARVANGETRLDMDSLPLDAQSLSAQTMHVISEPVRGKPDAQPRYFLTAWEDAHARTAQKAISADRITYDSLKDLFYAYGEDGRYVTITEQRIAGISPSQNRTTTLRYNHKTGDVDLKDPQSFLIFDPKTGVRPTPVPYNPNVKPPVRQKRPFVNSRMNIERKDFNGH